MIARIETVGVHQPSGLTYADVSFWFTDSISGEPDLRNDFLIEVHATGRRRTANAAGYLQTVSGRWLMPQVEQDGDWVDRPEDPVDPWLMQTVELDQPAQLTGPIADFARRAIDYRGDHRGVPADEVTSAGLPAPLAALAGTVLTIE